MRWRRDEREASLDWNTTDGNISEENLEASLRAKDWIDSIERERETEEGDQTGQQYSRIGRTRETYNRRSVAGEEDL